MHACGHLLGEQNDRVMKLQPPGLRPMSEIFVERPKISSRNALYEYAVLVHRILATQLHNAPVRGLRTRT